MDTARGRQMIRLLKTVKKMRPLWVLFVFFPSLVMAQLNAADMVRLGIEGTELTPMGAIRAGNKEGTIPAWNSKPIKVKNLEEGSLTDPFSDEKPLFRITADNYTAYQDKLTPGQVALFKAYPATFFMDVYPTHRTAAYDEWIYQATLAQAKNVKVCPEFASENKACLVDQIDGGGVPFPIPKTGVEAVWSHFLAFRERSSNNMVNGALIDYFGHRTDVITQMRQIWPWWVSNDSDLKEAPVLRIKGGAVLCGSQLLLKPVRTAGLVFGACLYANNISAHGYLYLPGQRRVRKAPEIGFHDSPAFGSDGQVLVEDRWMMWFGGSHSRFNYSVPIKKELYVPYNSNRLAQKNTSFDEIFGKKHLNQAFVRYELHRAWVVTGTLRKGENDLYSRQTAYFDEDSWVGLANETYNQKNQLWRVGEQYNVFISGPNITRGIGDVHIDLINGRYATYPFWQYQTGEQEGFGPPRYTVSDDEVIDFNVDIYTPQGLRRIGRR